MFREFKSNQFFSSTTKYFRKEKFNGEKIEIIVDW